MPVVERSMLQYRRALMKSRRFAVAVVVVALASACCWLIWPSPQWQPLPIASIEMTCFSETEPVAYSFCVNRAAGSKSADVVYHLHGRHGAATWWNDSSYYSGEVNRLWAERGVEPPIVVGVSFGPVWLLVGELGRVFAEVVVPRVERELRHPVGRRMVVGESMGGVNALLVGLKSKQLFTRVAALCAPLPTVAPFSSASQLIAYVDRSKTSWRRAATLLALARTYYPSNEFWRENNPVPLAGAYSAEEGGPAFYLSCGQRDEWGCLEGNEVVRRALERSGAAVEWHLTAGGHCDVDTSSLATFLSH